MRRIRTKNAVLALVVTVGFICLICTLWDSYYAVNDDVTFGKRLSGCYTGVPDPAATLTQYPLACVISFLFRVFPRVDVWRASGFKPFYLSFSDNQNSIG